ncbi:MAG TPA: MinD/ParA family protein [Spirochaetota bacterium]|nr:MinD/ParA family protein [Spirochaetota bacterium]HOF12711.1 MinD/ParA family protein [Spirochaetota bacterium]HOM87205.1 MinD/ParA family protein [Spirochaetota bacterium]HOR92392.1 MinD/ParA family protein [Spirochaetota bacterium]HOT19602.1 MinD/ParA family protein [Spirochaetota bacterium]
MDQAANLRRLVVENNTARRTKTIAITSGKGGVGKTSIAVSLAIALAKRNYSITLLDADLGLANVNVVLGIIPKYNLYHVIKGKKKLEEIIIDVPEGIKIIAGASGFHQLANLDVKQREYFIKSLAELNADDYMIIDTGAGISQNVLSFLVASDEVIVITTPEPTSITDAYGTIKAIAANDPDKTVKLLVNRAQTVTEAKKVAQRVINIAGQFLNIKVDNLGFIFDDLYVAKSIRNQKPFIVSYPKSKASTCVEIIADRIGNIESDIDKGTGMLSFFRRFFGHYEMDNDDGVV